MSCSLLVLAARKRLVLLVMLVILMTSEQSADGAAGTSSMALPGCPDKCGNTSVPYPFGFTDGCFQEPFGVYCEDDQAVYLQDSKRLKVLEFNLFEGEIHIQKRIANSCDDSTQNNVVLPVPGQPKMFVHGGMVSDGIPYVTVSTRKNKFTAIGCATTAIIQHWSQHKNYTSGCVSFCNEDSIEDSTQCNGMGCCQTSVPGNLSAYQPSFLAIGGVDYTTARKFSPCSYAFIVEQNWFKFNASYVKTREYGEMYGVKGRGVPLVLDWSVGDQPCDEAKRNKSSYLCTSTNSECTPVRNGAGYLCQCSSGYEGNPYLQGGCHDINECDNPSIYPCKGTKCHNTDGNYTCSCKPGTHSDDPKNISCTGSRGSSKMVIGMSLCSTLIVVCIFAVLNVCQKRKLAKDKKRFFVENGGMILYQQILSRQVETVTIFTLEVLKKATNNFDKSMELGTGGQGTVYKGILSDKKVVAVKRSKVINMSQKEEFVQEIIILSQINHKNVVRLLGCCLEVEVPVLVYEFIPNGTLFHYLHGNHNRPPISLEVRLRIAQESAEALAYMHLSINQPIVHGDVKSLNILLDENYMAKVSDFGASRMLPKDVIQLMTMVQGTWGYLDPEYLQERKLTEKSDVYSFGVVLLELITRKKAIYSEGPEEEESLASSFLHAMRDNRVEGILDTSIMGEETVELLQEVAELGRQCLSVKGEDRPSMAQVADKLKTVRSSWRELLLLKHSKSDVLIERSSMTSDASPSHTSWPMDIETASVYHASSSNCTA